LSSTTITTVRCAAISVSIPGAVCAQGGGRPLIWIKEI
jgi:hypothetical protein